MRAYLMIVVFAIAVPDRPDPTPKQDSPPQHRIIGNWQHLNHNGKGASGHTLRVTPLESTWTQNGQPITSDGLTAMIKVDASTSPAAIDFISRQGGTIRAIWKVEGDSLTVAVTPGNPGLRPTNFAPSAGVQVYTRIK
jgi:uncharacterized protein (TIGR03067 family)